MGWGSRIGRIALGAGTLGVSEMLRDQGEQQAEAVRKAGKEGAAYITGPNQSAYNSTYAKNASYDMRNLGHARGEVDVGGDWRNDQRGLAAMLQQRAMGQGGPSVAQNQLNQAMDRRVADARSMALSMDGMSPAAAAYMAQRGASQAMGDTAGQMATLRAQEQIAAQQQLAGVLGQGRGQDLETQQAKDQAMQNYFRLGLGADQQYMQGQMAGDAANLQAQLARAGMISGANMNAAQAQNQYTNMLIGGGMNAAGRLIPMFGSQGQGQGQG